MLITFEKVFFAEKMLGSHARNLRNVYTGSLNLIKCQKGYLLLAIQTRNVKLNGIPEVGRV